MTARTGPLAAFAVVLAGGLRLWMEAAALDGAAAFVTRVGSLGRLGGGLVAVTALAASAALVARSRALWRAPEPRGASRVLAAIALFAALFMAADGLAFALPLLSGDAPASLYEESRLLASRPGVLAFVVTGLTASVWSAAGGLLAALPKTPLARALVVAGASAAWLAALNIVAHFGRGAAFVFERTGL